MFRTIDHSADVAVEIEGDTIEELFIEGMCALSSIAVKCSEKKIDEDIEVEVEGIDMEDLFVRWLNEGIYLIYVKKLLPVKISHVRIKSLKIFASLGVKRIVQNRERYLMELKAATYHGLSLEKVNRGYRIKVVFDI